MASVGKSSLVFAAMTLISRVLGLIRDILIARYFGATITDPFFAALRIPNTLRRFFAEGSFANAFVPVFSATRAEHPDALRDLLRHTSGTLLYILAAITLAGVLGSTWVIYVIAHGLTAKPEQFVLANHMLKIMFPYILLISLTAMAGGVLNSHGKFAIPAITPVFLNITLIGAGLYHYFISPNSNGIELAWAVLLGGIIQLAIQLPSLYRLHLLCLPKWGWHHAGVRKIMKLMLPTLFGSSIGQLSILINTFLASMLVTGSISWLYYSDRMVELPIALIGVALGTVILPRLSALKAQDNREHFQKTLDWALRCGLLVGTAATCGLFILAPAILAALFYGGRFNAHDVLMSTLSLRAYACSVVLLILVKVLAPAFYARQDTKTPVKAGISAVCVNILMALILSRFYGHVGLAAASSFGALVNVSLLLYFLSKTQVKINLLRSRFCAQIIVANAAMIAILVYFNPSLDAWIAWGRGMRIVHLVLLVILGMMSYAIALLLAGVRVRNLKIR